MKCKKILSSFLVALFILQLFTPVALAADEKLILGQGLFTSSSMEKAPNNCEVTADVGFGNDKDTNKDKEGEKNNDDEKLFGNPSDQSDGGKAGDLLEKLFNSIVESLKGFFEVTCDTKNFLGELTKITDPVNLTTNSVIMSIMGTTQLMALGITVILIAVFAVMYAFNYENLNPMQFGMRVVVAMMGVYFLPYLIQDMLNINNALVYYISHTGVSGDIKASLGAILAFVSFKVVEALVGAVITGGAAALVIGIAIIMLLVYLIMQLLKIIIWWYMRMITIFLLAVIGPFFVILMALPQTAEYASKWLKMMIAEVFHQLIFAIGLFFFISLFLRMKEFGAAADLSMIGKIFLFYAGVLFLVKLPDIGKEMLGGGLRSTPMKDAMMAATAAAGIATAMVGKGSDMANAKMAERKMDKNTKNDSAAVSDKLSSGLQAQMANVRSQSDASGANAAAGGANAAAGGANAASAAAGGANAASAAAGGANAASAAAGGANANGADPNQQNNEPILNGGDGADPNQAQSGNGSDQVDTQDTDAGTDSNIPEFDLEAAMQIMDSDSREQALNSMQRDIAERNPDMNEFESKQLANNTMAKFEESQGMTFGAIKQVDALAKSGDLSMDKFKEIAEKDMDQNPDFYKGNKENYAIDHEGKEKFSKSAALDNIMHGKGWGDIVPKESAKDRTKTTEIPTVKMGELEVHSNHEKAEQKMKSKDQNAPRDVDYQQMFDDSKSRNKNKGGGGENNSNPR